jgi:hypothetical protein
MPIIDFSNIEYHNNILSEETISDNCINKAKYYIYISSILDAKLYDYIL